MRAARWGTAAPKRILLLALILVTSACLLSCGETVDTTPTPTTPAATTPAPIEPDSYYVATVEANDQVLASPYTGGVTVHEMLSGVYYSADAPGGAPVKDGTGKIWLILQPTERNGVAKIEIEGTYTEVEDLGKDLYCIHGVGSDLTVKVSTEMMRISGKDMVGALGYGITDEGQLILTWEQTETDPLRYVELSYTENGTTHTQYIDASLGKYEGPTLTENTPYEIFIRGISYTRVGKRTGFDVCYMTEPKSVAFPRVEITTENYMWPSFDVVHSPDKYWGSGITNALYEQCTVTVFDAKNNVIYDSTTEMSAADAFLGAKIKVRGNTSASHADHSKFPYKIKLNAKTDLLAPLTGRPGDGKEYAAKDWLLLNFGEDGYRIGGDAIADAVGTEWSPDYCYVSLYVNGDYRGLYVLSESVERGNGSGDNQSRVAIDKDGFLFECDAYWWNEDLYFNTPMTENTAMFFTFKHPDPDLITEDSPEYAYLKNYMIRFEEALMREDDSYLDYIDLDSFVKWLLVSDYLCISDGGGANIFLYKKDATDSSKLFLGPNWDFDSWMGDVDGLSTIRLYWNTCPFYIPYLLRKDSFQERYTELFYETRDALDAYIDAAYAATDAEAHLSLLAQDHIRFGTKVKSLETVRDEFKDWLDKHIAWMETQLK